jgi:type I restriction enzyme S subunit
MIYTPEPPPAEQAAIVLFLDWANGRLERAIRAKRKVIALLSEQKQAIIHRAVTRGLDSSVPLKPSGIPWLGDIPQHWEVTQLRRLVKYGTSITYGIVQAGPDIEGGVPYIRTSDMKGESLPRTGYLRTSRGIDCSYTRSKVESGDLVVAIRATLGKGLLVPEYLAGANLTQGTAKVSPGERLTSQFLYSAFNSKYCQESIRIIAKGTTFLEITLEALRRIALAVPPREEQEMICASLAVELRPLNTTITRLECEIELLHEFRTRLVADVVTGKLDVREAASQLPDESIEAPTDDDADLGEETEPADEEEAA